VNTGFITPEDPTAYGKRTASTLQGGQMPERQQNFGVCKYFQNGFCRFGDTCTFTHAHKGADAASKWLETISLSMEDEENGAFKYSRVEGIKENAAPNMGGMGSSADETLRNQLLYIIRATRKYSHANEGLERKLKQAKMLIDGRKLQAAAKVLYTALHTSANGTMDRLTMQQILVDAANNRFPASDKMLEDVDLSFEKVRKITFESSKLGRTPARRKKFRHEEGTPKENKEILSALKKTLHAEGEMGMPKMITEDDELLGRKLNPFLFLQTGPEGEAGELKFQ
jgi:hypothetical protein